MQGVFIQKHESISAASIATNIKRSNISSALIGKQLSAGGFQWRYDGEDPPGIYNAKSTNQYMGFKN